MLSGFSASAQFTFSEDFALGEHFIQGKAYRNALQLLHSVHRNDLTPFQNDSLDYMLGWTYYNEGTLDSASHYLSKVGESSPFWHKSLFYESFLFSYQHEHEQAIQELSSAEFDQNAIYVDLRNFELAGIALLQRNFPEFDRRAALFTQSHYQFATEEKSLMEYRTKLGEEKSKSPFVAGVLSAVVPGSGKWYAGYKGQALAAFTTVGMIGAVAAENLIKGGVESPGFIVAASVFTIFYVGNIWGSAIAVKIKRDEIRNTVNNSILLDIHIPLRRVFR